MYPWVTLSKIVILSYVKLQKYRSHSNININIEHCLWSLHHVSVLSGVSTQKILEYQNVIFPYPLRSRVGIDRFHVTSQWPCWCTRTIDVLSFGNQTLFLCIFHATFCIVFYTNMAAKSREWKPSIVVRDSPPPPGEGGKLFKGYIGMCGPKGVCFFSRFGLK